jgi:hypothetical protein
MSFNSSCYYRLNDLYESFDELEAFIEFVWLSLVKFNLKLFFLGFIWLGTNVGRGDFIEALPFSYHSSLIKSVS